MWGWFRQRGRRGAARKPRTEVAVTDESGSLALTFNHMVEGLRERDRIRDMFSRYMTRQVSDAILRGDGQLGGESRVVTVLMAQLREFEELVETLDTDALAAVINRYLPTAIECVTANDGVVDRFEFGGRVITVVFGAPVPDEQHAAKAMAAALELRRRMNSFADGERTLHLDIGVATGEVVTGNIGSENRMQYTVVGPASLAAERLMHQASATGQGLLVSPQTAAQAGTAFRFEQFGPTAWTVEAAG